MTQGNITERTQRSMAAAILVCASTTVFASPPKSTYVDRVIRLANQKIAEGESPEVVERWMTSLIDRQGAAASIEPASWDVFANAQWRNQQQTKVTSDPTESTKLADIDDRNAQTLLSTIRPGQVTSREGNDAGSAHARDDVLLPAGRSAGEGMGRPRSGIGEDDRTSRSSSDGTDAYARRMDATSSSDMGSPITDPRIVAKGGSPLQGR